MRDISVRCPLKDASSSQALLFLLAQLPRFQSVAIDLKSPNFTFGHIPLFVLTRCLDHGEDDVQPSLPGDRPLLNSSPSRPMRTELDSLGLHRWLMQPSRFLIEVTVPLLGKTRLTELVSATLRRLQFMAIETRSKGYNGK